MCGIIGYTGNKSFFSIGKDALNNLEYRGYDSAGIAFFDDKKIKIRKKKGYVNNLFKTIKTDIKSTCGIGHTRWATHGVPNNKNSHPHISFDGEFAVVHNGVIENYKELKDKYLKDIVFLSDTDTEVIPNLISLFYNENHDTIGAIQKTIKLLKGSYALAILHKNENDKIYFAKNESPLLVGIGHDENFISSDIVGFNDITNKYIIIDDLQLGYITSKTIEIFDEKLNKVVNKVQKNTEKIFKSSKNGFKHFMLKEINDIPLAISETVNLYQRKNNPLEQIPKDFFQNIDEIIFIACGTSYHSGLIGEKYIKELSSYKSITLLSSEFLYSNQKIDERTLCIFISQSGETADTLSAIKKAKGSKARCLGITNVPTSTIKALCDYVLPIRAGSEIAVASTKAYNAQITLLLIFSHFLANNLKINLSVLNNIKAFTKSINIKSIEKINDLSCELKGAKNIYFIGRDFDYITSMEAALKIKEISYIPCEAYPAGELKHGTLALITKNIPVIVLITKKELIEKNMIIVNQIISRGGKVYIFTQFDLCDYISKDYSIFKLPTYEQYFMPIYSIIPFQLLAYNISCSLGYNPDRPRNLAKSVTVE